MGYHDCIEPALGHRLPKSGLFRGTDCSGGLCVGMHDGPHEGGPASYPVGNKTTGFTFLSSTFNVPEAPQAIDGITYYIWTDIFFGDASYGRMNQFVPQLMLGSALDSSSGPPLYKPMWHTHSSWVFGSQYFFEVYNATSNKTEGHAATGDLFPVKAGELLQTQFEQKQNGDDDPIWTLTMSVVNDPSRTSVVVVKHPYMGLGKSWPKPTTSWTEPSYSNMCVNSCWELYGANDRAHYPQSGSKYDMTIKQPTAGSFPWVTIWDEDEKPTCPGHPNSTIKENHTANEQHIFWDIAFEN